MSKLTNEIQENIDEAHLRLDSIDREDVVVFVPDIIISAVELATHARLMAGKLSGGPPLKGALAQIDLLDQRIRKVLSELIGA